MRPNLTVLRSAILPMLTETGTVQRLTGYIFDEETGQDEPILEHVWSGPLLIRPQSANEKVVEVGGLSLTLTRYDVTFPAETAIPASGLLTITSADFDPLLVGAQFRIVDVPLDAWAVARYAVAERQTA